MLTRIISGHEICCRRNENTRQIGCVQSLEKRLRNCVEKRRESDVILRSTNKPYYTERQYKWKRSHFDGGWIIKLKKKNQYLNFLPNKIEFVDVDKLTAYSKLMMQKTFYVRILNYPKQK